MPPTTQQIQSLWTPTEVMTLLGFIAGPLLVALGFFCVKIIDAAKNAKIAIIQAQVAASQSQTAANQASETKGKTDQMSKQMAGLQNQVTAVAMQTPPVTPLPAQPIDAPKGA